ncbi:rhomboid family intramembrane serine protease [Flavobacteriales bacterium]|nr:rhomboid family intramembrane serine protease [Flavobacteriales bacterium]
MSENLKSDIGEMFRATRVPLLFLSICWVVWLIDWNYTLNLYHYGVKPRTGMGLLGVLFSPYIHDSYSYEHIVNNSSAMFVLLWALFYFYKKIAWRVFFGIWLIGGLWLWCLSRDVFHIGASGIIYGLASYIFISGLIRKNISLMGLSMIVVFLYGSMIWGILPFDYLLGSHYVDLSISFEGHFWGAAAGILLAFWYREQGPQRKKYMWQIEEEMGIDPPDFEGQLRQQEMEIAKGHSAQTKIKYIITKKSNERKE